MLSVKGAPVEVPVANVTPVTPVSVGITHVPSPRKNLVLVPPEGT